jgi:hypothetical protein
MHASELVAQGCPPPPPDGGGGGNGGGGGGGGAIGTFAGYAVVGERGYVEVSGTFIGPDFDPDQLRAAVHGIELDVKVKGKRVSDGVISYTIEARKDRVPITDFPDEARVALTAGDWTGAVLTPFSVKR